MIQTTSISIFSLNINGLSNQKFDALAQLLHQYDIIMLQETHLTKPMTSTYTNWLTYRRWRTFWGYSSRPNKRAQGGVAIWIREDLFQNGIVLSYELLKHDLRKHILSIRLQCRDQSFVLSSIYMPVLHTVRKLRNASKLCRP